MLCVPRGTAERADGSTVDTPRAQLREQAAVNLPRSSASLGYALFS